MNTVKLTTNELSQIYSALRYRLGDDDPLVEKIVAALLEARRR